MPAVAGYNPRAGARDMLLSLAVLLVPVVAIVWLFQTEPEEPPLQAVDWKASVAQARAEADFPVLAPVELPAQWRATSTYWATAGQNSGGRTLSGDEFSLGLLDQDQRHLALKQSDGPSGAWLTSVTRQAQEVGSVTVEGRRWTTWVSADGRTHYLSSTVEDSTVLLAGDFDQEPLVSFAEMLDEG